MNSFEDILQRTFSKLVRPGDVVIDVGAHSGFHARRLAELVGEEGRLFAFEPLKDVFAALLNALHKKQNVFLFNIALADTRGEVAFVRADGALEESGLRRRVHYNHPEVTKPLETRVWCETLDHVFCDAERVDYIKVDVEGGEMSVLAGAETLIRRTRPLISVEYGAPGYAAYGHDKWTLWNWARDRHFSLFDVHGSHLADEAAWDLCCDGAVWDFWLVPHERRESFVADITPDAKGPPKTGG